MAASLVVMDPNGTLVPERSATFPTDSVRFSRKLDGPVIKIANPSFGSLIGCRAVRSLGKKERAPLIGDRRRAWAIGRLAQLRSATMTLRTTVQSCRVRSCARPTTAGVHLLLSGRAAAALGAYRYLAAPGCILDEQRKGDGSAYRGCSR